MLELDELQTKNKYHMTELRATELIEEAWENTLSCIIRKAWRRTKIIDLDSSGAANVDELEPDEYIRLLKAD